MKPVEGTVLVTGATGFIGGRLVNSLLQDGFRVRCLVRKKSSALPAQAQQVEGDLLEVSTVPEAMKGIDTAFYLVHSMAGKRAGFEERDRNAAGNFSVAADKAHVRRVIYLGGLGDVTANLSEHLASRLEVANILRSGRFSTTVLRAAVIIGAGGASYEMIRFLVERLPVMITPRWVSTRCQPIAVNDVVRYLVGCIRDEDTAGQVFDIGGPEILSYREMMERFARISGHVNFIVPVPFLTPRLSSYWVGLFTPVKPSISMPLIEGLKNEVICRDHKIRELIPMDLTTYDEAVRLALAETSSEMNKDKK